MDNSKINFIRKCIYNKDYKTAKNYLKEINASIFAYQEYILLIIVLLNGNDSEINKANEMVKKIEDSYNNKLKVNYYREFSKYYLKCNDIKKAMDMLNKLYELGGVYQAEACYYMATINYKNSNYYDAIRLFGISIDKRIELKNNTNNIELIKKNKNSLNNTLIYLVRSYIKINEFDLALNILNNDENINNNSDIVDFYKGKCYFEKKIYDKACYYFQKVCSNKRNRMYTNAYFELGRTYFQLNRYIDSINIFQKIYNSKIKKDKLYATMELAKIELSIGNPMKAKKYLHELLGEDQKSREFALLELGRLERKEKNYETAKYYFKSLIDKFEKDDLKLKKNKTYYMTIFELGKAEMLNKNYTEAIENFKILSLSENAKDKYIGNIYCVYALIKLKNYELAYSYLETAKKIDFASKGSEIEIIETFLLKKLGKIKYKDAKNYPYFSSQMINYNRKNSITRLENKNTFYYDYNKVFNCCEDLIIDKEIDSFTYCDSYYLTFENMVANIYGLDTNKLEVFTLSNTKNIIDIKPVVSKKVDYHVNKLKK